ncbi:bud emergence protein 1, partial [Mortierella sp. 14UC]
MSNLRRSLQNKASNGGLSPTRTPAVAMAPPRKVIKALYDYNSQQSQELSFSKGDFFHVVGNEDDEDWYEAANPITGARGFVPVTYFQSLEKTVATGPPQRRQRNSNQSFEDIGNDSGSFTDPVPHHYNQQQQQQQYQQNGHYQHSHSLSNGGGALADELDCKAGDAILVIAQSNEEWYVAKPIGRLGGPGLIPVSFVEIRDMVTGKAINVPEMLRQTGTAIPRVDEWKKQAMEYKANSIPLGRIDDNQPQQQQPQQQPVPVQQPQQQVQQQAPHSAGLGMHPQHFIQQQQPQQSTGPTIQQLKNKMSRGDLKSQNMRDMGARRRPSQEDIGRRVDSSSGATALGSARSHHNDAYDDNSGHADPSRIINASVESFHHEDDQYWFTVRVELGSGATRNLFRLYEDFYDFHIALLEEFPVESGRVGDQPRILPFMPIPLQVVTDTVSASRRADLDGYVQDLCKLPGRITQHPLVEQLFAIREGDTETPMGGSTNGNGHSTGHGNGGTASKGHSSPSLGRPSTSNGSSLPSSVREQDRRLSPSANGGGTRAAFPSRNQGQRSYGDDSPSGGASPSMRSQAQFPGNSNGSGLGVGGLNGSASSEEMIKIKISYHEDIMAMRIPVSISFRSLQQKIFERLHSDHKDLSYRDDRGDFATIQNDADIRDAIDRSG